MTLNADAELLLTRLRNAHRARVDAIAVRKHGTAHAAATVAQDLVDEASPELLRAAQPDGGQPPIPVVLGPQDAATATVSVDEVMGLAYAYLEAGFAYQDGKATEGAFQLAYKRLHGAVEQLATAAYVAGGRSA